MINLKHTIYYLSFLTLLMSCATQNMTYNHKRLLKKASKNYTFFVDNEKADFRNIILDKHNIKSVVMHRKIKEVYITQIKNNLVFVKDCAIVKDSLIHKKASKKINDLVIIDGLRYNLKNVRIDTTIIETIQLYNTNKLRRDIFCKPMGYIVLIQTKQN